MHSRKVMPGNNYYSNWMHLCKMAPTQTINNIHMFTSYKIPVQHCILCLRLHSIWTSRPT